jgi:signal transduction histidine kinase
LAVVPLLQTASEKQKQDIGRLEAELVSPVRSAQGMLVGVLTIGPKTGGRLYTLEDETSIIETANHLAVNLENAYLYGVEKSLREQLEKEAKGRTEFLYAAAHEMRTPLTSIMAASELLAIEFPPDPTNPRAELVDNIRASAENLHRRTSELLEFARMRTSGLDIILEPTDVGGLVRRLCRQYEPLLKKRSQSAVPEIEPDLPKVIADPLRLDQIFLNLLSNASKFSPANTDFRVTVSLQAGNVVVSVNDRAPPLSIEERDKLFQPYYRGENPKRVATGLGLGLAISRHLVELHGGRIWAQASETGNTFSFSLLISGPPDAVRANNGLGYLS